MKVNDEISVCAETSRQIALKQILIVLEGAASLLITCSLPHYMEQIFSRQANRVWASQEIPSF